MRRKKNFGSKQILPKIDNNNTKQSIEPNNDSNYSTLKGSVPTRIDERRLLVMNEDSLLNDSIKSKAMFANSIVKDDIESIKNRNKNFSNIS